MMSMTLAIGQLAPNFEARSDDGQQLSLRGLSGQWVVLYFFPRAGTPGCNLEAQRFEQLLPEFERLEARIIGVSSDTEAKQALFRDTCQLSFPLLPDSQRQIAQAYQVTGGLLGRLGLDLLSVGQRCTYLIDPGGKVARIWRNVRPAQHAAEVLRDLQARQGAEQTLGTA